MDHFGIVTQGDALGLLGSHRWCWEAVGGFFGSHRGCWEEIGGFFHDLALGGEAADEIFYRFDEFRRGLMGGGQFNRRCRLNPGGKCRLGQFARRCRLNCLILAVKRPVEPESGSGDAFDAEGFQSGCQCFHEARAISGPVRAVLLILDDVAPEKPVPDHEGEIHRTDGLFLHFLMRQSAEFNEVVEIHGIAHRASPPSLRIAR